MSNQETWQVEVFYDGECPLCMREIAMLRRRDRRGRIRFSDITARDFEPERFGKTRSEFMARIQGRLPDGTWIDGVEVFRRLYAAIGLGWLVAVTRAPGVSQLLDVAYRAFASRRLRLTGRCQSGSCELPASR